MKKLVIVTHPFIESSIINRTWLDELQQNSDQFEVHSLYRKYPDLQFDIRAEQALLEDFEEIIFQFPIHWFSVPFALKKYIDEVFSFGWAFGPGGDKLAGKQIGFAVSTGGDKASYDNGIPLTDLLNDVRLSFEFCGCHVGEIHAFYGAMTEPSDDAILGNAKAYVATFMLNAIGVD